MKRFLITAFLILAVVVSGYADDDDDKDRSKRKRVRIWKQLEDGVWIVYKNSKQDEAQKYGIKQDCPEVPTAQACELCLDNMEFTYTLENWPGAELSVWEVYGLGDGKGVLLKPTWSDDTGEPPIPEPEPEWEPTKDNAFNSCQKCHDEEDARKSKFQYNNWYPELHDEHEERRCTACHER